MTAKSRDEHNRWRSVTVGFRMSPEENEQLDRLVHLSGLTKQDYIIRRLLERDVVVQGNPRVYKALRDEMSDILNELKRLHTGEELSDEHLEIIRMIAVIMGEMRRGADHESGA